MRFVQMVWRGSLARSRHCRFVSPVRLRLFNRRESMAKVMDSPGSELQPPHGWRAVWFSSITSSRPRSRRSARRPGFTHGPQRCAQMGYSVRSGFGLQRLRLAGRQGLGETGLLDSRSGQRSGCCLRLTTPRWPT